MKQGKSESDVILERLRKVLVEASRNTAENSEWATRVIANWNKGKNL